MTTNFLYANFLDDKRVYNLAQASWKKLLGSLLKDFGYSQKPYLNELQNGQKEYDGNPIFNAYIPEIQRAIRIIQVSPKEEGNDISAWIDDIELQKDNPTKELVLDLKLSKEAKKTARKLMQKWISKDLDEEKVDLILKK